MGISQQEREERRERVGASDIAPIMGLCTFKNAVDIFAEKVYGTDETPELAAMMGTDLEPVALDYAERLFGRLLRRGRRVQHPTVERLRVNLDGELAERPGAETLPEYGEWTEPDIVWAPVDGKTTGITGPMWGTKSEWGEAWGPVVPPRVTLQMNGQMMCTGAEHSYVSAFIAGRGHVIYVIPRNDDLCAAIEVAIGEFWEYVESKTPPPDQWLSIDVAKHIRRPEGKTIVLELPAPPLLDSASMQTSLAEAERGKGVVDVYEALGKVKSAAEKARKLYASIIQTRMGNAEIGTLADGRQVSYKGHERASVDMDVLRARFVAAFEDTECRKIKTVRRLLTHKAKDGG